ncbi:uncharacterized protein LOC134223226 [Armigeres subalbatus]|uniref:uncharacterized protein LOC134223226 n=1 Tax=Armigeres subalbatus TaxID=124917 RepID=UPI002ED2AE44
MATNGGVPVYDAPRSIGIRYGPDTRLNCCVEGCVSMYGDIGISFHRFPTINTARDVLRRELWVEAAGLPNDANVIDNALICGRHFEKGKPSLPNEIRAPNWTPSLQLNTLVAPRSIENAIGGGGMTEPSSSNVLVPIASLPHNKNQVSILPIMGPQTVPKDMNLPEYCRLCLTENVQLVFPKDSRVYDQLATKISDHLRITITVAELTRCMICKKCYEMLEQFHQFRIRCVRQEMYLNMRRCLEPDRKHPLRYKDNWYWYSCLGNNMNSVIWGCSVVCCPAFIVSHPSGRICSKYANHQHKQKMDDVKAIYCNGEYIYDGYRYSFEVINLNRTLSFSCRSLKDPHNECTAVLTSNDRSEVLSVGVHNHEREIIIESAVKDAVDGAKRSITLIRGFNNELVVCQGYWYRKVSEQSSVSHWNCIRNDCTSTITMVNGTVQYFGTHCHLPVFLKWGAEEDRTIEPKTTTLMKIVNPTAPKPTAIAETATVRQIPPVAFRESTTIVHSAQPTISVIPSSQASQTRFNVQPIATIIKTEQREMSPIHLTYNRETLIPSTMVRTQPTQPLVVSAAVMASKAAPSLPTSVQSNVNAKFGNPISVVKRTTAPTVRVVAPPRPKLVLPSHAPKLSVLPTRTNDQPSAPTVPKILHVMSLNLAHQPEPTSVPEVIVTVSQPLSVSQPTESIEIEATIKQEPDPDPEDDAETITDEINTTDQTPIPAPSMSADPIAEHLPKPPPLTPRPMMLVSSASVVSNNTLDITSLDQTCIDGLESAPNKPATEGLQQQRTVVDEDDGLHDLQDDDEIPPIVPIDADIVSRIIGNEYTTRVLPNGKTQVIRKAILSRSSGSASQPTMQQQKVLSAAQLLAGRTELNVKSVRKIGSSNAATASKRNSDAGELEDPLSKKTKISDPLEVLEPVIVNVEKSTEPDNTEQEQDELAAEDPIAVSTEPHQNLSDEEPEQTDYASSDEPIVRSSSTSEKDESSNQDMSAPEQERSAIVQEPAVVPDVTPDPQESQSDKKMSSSKSVQLVKLQRTQQMLSHEGHLYKLKWHNRRRNYWDCMLREQVNCMAILETVGEDSRHWRKYGAHNHKIPKPIINDENRSSYRMLTNETNLANVKQLPIQTTNICDVQENVGRMMSLAKRKLFGYKIKRIGKGVILYYANYEYRYNNMVGPGFRWKCASCSCTIETDEKFTIAQEVGMVHNHDPHVPDVIELEDDAPSELSNAKAPLVQPKKTVKAVPTTNDESIDVDPLRDAIQEDVTDSDKEPEPTPQETEAQDELTEQTHETPINEKAPVTKSAVQQTQVQSSETSLFDEDEDPIDAMLREITGDQDEPTQCLTNPPSAGNESDEEELTLDPSTGDMVKIGELKRKEYRKTILEDIVADEDDDEMEYLDPLTGEMRRKGDQPPLATEPLPDNADDQNSSDLGTVVGPKPSNVDFEDLLKKGSPKAPLDTRKLKGPKKNSLAALKMVVEMHKQLKKPDPERNFEVLPAPGDENNCLIRFNEYTYELDTVTDVVSVWKCHLSPQYTCRGKIHLKNDCQQVLTTGVNHCHPSTQVDMFTELPRQLDGQITDSDIGAERKYTFFKRPDDVYQLRLDDGYMYNCLTIAKTGVSCWRCADRQTHNCKAMFTMEGEFKSLVRNRFSHPHDPVDLGQEEGTESEENGKDSIDQNVTIPTKRSAKDEHEDDVKKPKRQTL